ncbi:MAG: hypothetical protein PHP10_03635 [Candidatus Omnitrophica bacterium]|nr:hypothetical protein [Candidatus Omnitrophota bacterium]
MKESLKTFGFMILAIVFTGIVLDELGKGRLGNAAKSLAQKVTSGYGA